MTFLLYAACAVTYGLLALLVLVRGRSSRTGLWLAVVAIGTACWSAAVAGALVAPLGRLPALLDLAQSAGWYTLMLHLYRGLVSAGGRMGRVFVTMGLVALLMAGVAMLTQPSLSQSGLAHIVGQVAGVHSLIPGDAAIILGLAVCKLLLVENLYLNTPADLRWHINLPCIAMTGLFALEMAVFGEMLLFGRAPHALYDTRAIGTMVVAPLLALAAARNRRWRLDIQVSRAAVFQSATLVASGLFLLGLAALGEVFRRFGPNWGDMAELSLLFAGIVALAVLVTSGAGRGRIRRLLVDPFFSHRYDYRREWTRCIETLLPPETYVALHGRVIRAVANVVDSPAGALFLREPGETGFHWAGSWNMPAVLAPVMPDHPLVALLDDGAAIVEASADTATAAIHAIADAWLAVPLSRGGQLSGFILVIRPRSPFRLDAEVFSLLRIIASEVATYIAEQQAARALLQARELHEYGQRFAFVAHDIKNVSSQLSLLLSNAERHIGNPEFQRDMLTTVAASVRKISALLKRLQMPADAASSPVIMPLERMAGLLAASARLRGDAVVALERDGGEACVAMDAAAFDAVFVHLLNNAHEATSTAAPASAPAPVVVRVRCEKLRLLIDVVDSGPGMTPEFVRDDLFTPFRTSKPEGSGIGAFQARALLREAGGDLLALSRPGGGTTMRLLLPLAEAAAGFTAPPARKAAA